MRRLWLAVGLWLVPALASADVVTRLPTTDKTVALTFDGCEGTGKPAWLDHALVDVLQREQVPFTIQTLAEAHDYRLAGPALTEARIGQDAPDAPLSFTACRVSGSTMSVSSR